MAIWMGAVQVAPDKMMIREVAYTSNASLELTEPLEAVINSRNVCRQMCHELAVIQLHSCLIRNNQ